jgi:hypothetical protein
MKDVPLQEKNLNNAVVLYNCKITIAKKIIANSIKRYFLFFKMLVLILSNIDIFIDKFSDAPE